MRRILGCTISTILLALAPLGVALADDGAEPPGLRLGQAVRPHRAVLDLTLVPGHDTFQGREEIALDVERATPLLWLNAMSLRVQSATLEKDGHSMSARIRPGSEETVGFDFGAPLSPGKAVLRVTFEGSISRLDDEGVFQRSDGGKWYIYSQFETTFARRAFPCFDEPSFKIPWQLTLHVPREDVALANTPIVAEHREARGMKAVVFAETRPLPSYLVAFGVGPFEIVDAGKAGRNATPLRILAPQGHRAELAYAAETVPRVLTTLEDYFGIAFPYPKLDTVAIPELSTFGAMENAGLITYDAQILYLPADAPISRRRFFAGDICAHEMAHQWFGDLVTTAWWDDTWLNEGFATWMATKVSEKWHPEWGAALARTQSRSYVMGNDSLVSARSVRQPIESADDIANAFDSISYEKGAALLSMFEGWMGEQRFREGVRRYLTAHADGNATAADFLSALDEAGGAGVASAFSSFLDQPGVPLLSIERICTAGSRARLHLRQRRFLPVGSTGSGEQRWQIPVRVRCGDAGEARLLMKTAEEDLELPGSSCPTEVVANLEGVGYYKTLYRGDLLEPLLAGEIREASEPELASLLADTWSLTKSVDVPMAKALALVPAITRRPTRQVVEDVASFVTSLDDSVVSDSSRAAYARFVRESFGPRAHDLGMAPQRGENEDIRLLRPTLVKLAAIQGEDVDLRAQAAPLARAWLKDRKAVDPDMVNVVLAIAAQDGGSDLFDQLLAEAKATKSTLDRQRLLRALSFFRDSTQVDRALALLLSNEFDIRDSILIPLWIAQQRQTRERGYEFIEKHFDALLPRLPHDFANYLLATASRFCDSAHLRAAESFFTPRMNALRGGPRDLAQTLETIRLCIALREAQRESTTSFFDAVARQSP